MKANEAPEKIYVQRFDVDEEESKFDKSKMFFDDIWVEEPESPHNYIEYIRKDAFIKKACKWLKEVFEEYENITDYNPMEDFLKAMEE